MAALETITTLGGQVIAALQGDPMLLMFGLSLVLLYFMARLLKGRARSLALVGFILAVLIIGVVLIIREVKAPVPASAATPPKSVNH